MIFEDGFSYYSIIINFLERTFGELTEITLYSFEDGDEGKLIAKSSNCSFKLGSATPKTLRKLLDKYNNKKESNDNIDFITNFPGKDNDGKLFRVSTFFIKGEKNSLKGAFNIKVDISEMVYAANFLNKALKELTGGLERNLEKESEEVDELGTIEEYSIYLINQYFDSLKKPMDAMTTSEKIEIVKSLDKKGIFNLKGSVGELAKRFNTSEKTIYRYLSSEQ